MSFSRRDTLKMVACNCVALSVFDAAGYACADTLAGSIEAPVRDRMTVLPPGAVRLKGYLERYIQLSIAKWSKGVVPYPAFAAFFRNGRPTMLGRSHDRDVRDGRDAGQSRRTFGGIQSKQGSTPGSDRFRALLRWPIVLARDENIDARFDQAVDVVATHGFVELKAVKPVQAGAHMQFEVPTRTGPIPMVDYASVNSWQGKKVQTWLPMATHPA